MLAEDVFYLVEDRGVALGRLVFYFQGRAELFDQLALFARELGGGQHADVIVQIAFAAAARVGESLGLEAEDRAALRALGNFQLFLAA